MRIRLSSLPLAVALLVAAGAAAQSPPEQAESQQVKMNVKMVRVDRGWSRTVAFRELKVLPPCRTKESPGQTDLFTGTVSANSRFLGVLRESLKNGQARVLSAPCLIALSGNRASFLLGGERAVPVPPGLGQVGVQFEEFGTRLKFLPVILGNGKIHLEVEPEISELDPNVGASISGTTVPGRTTQRVHTSADLKSGQTFVIGGLVQKATSPTESEAELLILVTPHIVAHPEVQPAPVAAHTTLGKGKAAEVAKLWEAYLEACDAGRPEVAKALALRLLDLDPACFRDRAAR